MRLDQLKIFIEASDLESFSKAGKKLHLTQPGVSSQIQVLEKFIGLPLFERHTHGVTLTNVGKVVYNFASEVLELQKIMESEIDLLISENGIKHLKIGATHLLGSYFLPLDILEFENRFPDISIEMELYNEQELKEALNEKRIDLGFIEGPISDEEFNTHLLAVNDLVLVASQNNTDLIDNTISIKDLPLHDYLLLEEHHGITRTMYEGFQYQNVILNKKKINNKFSNIHSLKVAIQRNGALTFLPRIAIQNELRLSILRELVIEDLPLHIPFWAITSKNSNVPLIANRLIQFFLTNQNIQSIKAKQDIVPCWEMMNCMEINEQPCIVYRSKKFPCWTVKGTPCKGPTGLDVSNCKECGVYLEYGDNRPILITQF